MGEACWDDVLGRMPEETLLVRRAAFGELLTAGKPVGFDRVAAATGLTPETTRRALRLVESAGMAETDEDRVVGIDGLTTRATRHEIELNGVSLWTWCAYDIVGIAAALEADAAGVTTCGWCDRRIEVAVRKGRPAAGTAVGWLPNESCSNVIEQFCPSALFFCS
ncbi:MAG TPA: organomercurial lyase, partial [Actinomycetota bacterium]|nr:organomercurial lyase [Actinomycetota bacterium]